MNILQTIQLVFNLLPIIRDAVNSAEMVFPASGSGAQKLALVKSVIEEAIAAITPVTGIFNIVWPMINAAITSIVSSFKSVKAEVTGSPAAAVVTDTSAS